MTATGVLVRDELLRIDREGPVTFAAVLCEAIREHQVALLAPRLEELSDLSQGRLGLCLAQVRGMSCGFLETLVRLSRRSEAAGGQLVVYELSREVRGLMSSTGLDATLTLTREREEAFAILTQTGPDRHGVPIGGPGDARSRNGGLSLWRLFGRAA